VFSTPVRYTRYGAGLSRHRGSRKHCLIAKGTPVRQAHDRRASSELTFLPERAAQPLTMKIGVTRRDTWALSP
jgi:hypothetical protein